MMLTVRSVTVDTPDVRAYELCAPDGQALPAFTAGAHVDLHLSNGTVRSYSIVSDQGDRTRYVLGIARDRNSRGGSVHIHDTLESGSPIEVGLPRNRFPLDEGAVESVMFAGGIGVTPIVGMVRRLNALGRDWRLYFACRSRQDAPFMAELGSFGPRVTYHFDDEHDGARLDIARLVADAGPDAEFYCCGPTPMLEAFKAAVVAVAPARVHFEHFGGIEAAAEGGFEVELARSGKIIQVRHGQTILEAVGAAGVAVPFSCQAGVCGSCETKVLGGEPDHRDLILTDSERRANKSMMICCSGALSDRILLDL